MFFEFLDFIVAAILLLLAVFQVILPIFNGTPLFPWFRKGASKQVKAAEEILQETVAQKEAADILKKAKEVQESTKQ